MGKDSRKLGGTPPLPSQPQNVISDLTPSPQPPARRATAERMGGSGSLGEAPRRPASAVQVNESPVGLTSLPEDLLDELMEHLSISERVQFGEGPSPYLSAATRQQADAARLEHAAPSINSLAAFTRALNGEGEGATESAAIATLQQRLQQAPLTALGGRILSLPESEQGAATDAWMAFPLPGIPDPLLSDLRRAAAKGPVGLTLREARLVYPWGEAYVEVERGSNVQAVAQARAIASEQSIESLSTQAVRVISHNLSEHDHLPTLLERAGVTSPRAHQLLQEVAAQRAGTAAVLSGESAHDLIERMGLTWPPATVHLLVQGALRDVAQGGNVSEVVNEYQLHDIRHRLELHSADTEGRRLVHDGVPPEDVAQQLGIQTPSLVDRLLDSRPGELSAATYRLRAEELMALPGGWAHQAVVSGGNVQQVAQSLGITAPNALAELESLAAVRIQSIVRSGDHLPTLMEQAGVTSPQWTEFLQQQVVLGVGLSAVHRGLEPAEVAQQIGITMPEWLHYLDMAAAQGDVSRGTNAQVAMRNRNITAPEARQQIEMWALNCGVERALEDGEPVDRIAERLGIVLPDVIRTLEGHAVASVGANHIRAGAEPEAIAAQMGIREPDARHMLDVLAAQRDIGSGGNAQQVMRERNIMVADDRRNLELWAVVTNGQRELDLGEPVDQIAQRLGIQDPQALQELQLRAAQRLPAGTQQG